MINGFKLQPLLLAVWLRVYSFVGIKLNLTYKNPYVRIRSFSYAIEIWLESVDPKDDDWLDSWPSPKEAKKLAFIQAKYNMGANRITFIDDDLTVMEIMRNELRLLGNVRKPV